MHRRATVRIAGAATVLALVGGGVAVAASSGADTTTQPTTPTTTQPAAPGRAGPPGRPPHGGPRGGGFGFGGGPMRGGLGDRGELARTAASYLGLSAAELRTELRAGRSLADVARAQNKSVDGLQDAIVAAAKTRLDRAVDDGWLGPKARDEALKQLRAHVAELVSSTPPAGGPRMRGHDRDGRGGACPPGGPRQHRGDRAGRDDSGSQNGSSEQRSG